MLRVTARNRTSGSGGPLPAALPFMSSLLVLVLDNCGVVGPLPTLGTAAEPMSLVELQLPNNMLSGTLARTALEGLPALERFNVRNNKLEGTLPGFHLNPALRLLDVAANGFTTTGQPPISLVLYFSIQVYFLSLGDESSCPRCVADLDEGCHMQQNYWDYAATVYGKQNSTACAATAPNLLGHILDSGDGSLVSVLAAGQEAASSGALGGENVDLLAAAISASLSSSAPASEAESVDTLELIAQVVAVSEEQALASADTSLALLGPMSVALESYAQQADAAVPLDAAVVSSTSSTVETILSEGKCDALDAGSQLLSNLVTETYGSTLVRTCTHSQSLHLSQLFLCRKAVSCTLC